MHMMGTHDEASARGNSGRPMFYMYMMICMYYIEMYSILYVCILYIIY